MKATKIFEEIQIKKVIIDDVTFGLRQVGEGKDLVFIHGFPTHGYTWRKLIPELSKVYKCHILDLPGLGESDWSSNTDFKSESLANYIRLLLRQLGINKYSIVAHDSGATIARAMACKPKSNIENLILFNTEIPFHRPPWIPFYQKVGLLPMVPNIIRQLLKQKWFIKSSMGFRELYSDKTMLENNENIAPYIQPIIRSKAKTIGAFKFLKGIDWAVVDGFKETHLRIEARTLFLWGENDKTFPVGLAKKMVQQFSAETKFITIHNASLLPHEEKPLIVTAAILKFLKGEI